MKSNILLPVLLSLFAAGSALDILPTSASSNFPACGLSCAVFQQAQEACGAQSPNLAAENCFCQFSTIQPFYASADNVCTDTCSNGGDRSTLKSWFTSFCSQVGAGNDPLAGAATTTATSPTSSPTYQPGVVTDEPQNGMPWLKTHWQWLLMLIILAIGLTGVAFLLKWFVKRHETRVAEKTKGSSNRTSKRLSELILSPSEKSKARPASDQDQLWGPHQHQEASQGFAYDMEHGAYPPGGARADSWRTDDKSNTKGYRSNVQVTEVMQDHPDADFHSTELHRARTEERLTRR